MGREQNIRHFCRRSDVCQARFLVPKLTSVRGLDLPLTFLGGLKNFEKKIRYVRGESKLQLVDGFYVREIGAQLAGYY